MENDRIDKILQELGLDEEEITSVNKRNKLLEETTANEVSDIVNFFKIKCKVEDEDIARIIVKNPFILNESFSRINLLDEIYEKIGFSEREYKKYISNFDKAFSLNPKEVVDCITRLLEEGNGTEAVKRIILKDYNKIFGEV